MAAAVQHEVVEEQCEGPRLRWQTRALLIGLGTGVGDMAEDESVGHGKNKNCKPRVRDICHAAGAPAAAALGWGGQLLEQLGGTGAAAILLRGWLDACVGRRTSGEAVGLMKAGAD